MEVQNRLMNLVSNVKGRKYLLSSFIIDWKAG